MDWKALAYPAAVEPDQPETKTVYVPYPTSNSGVGGRSRAPATLPKGPFDGTGRYE